MKTGAKRIEARQRPSIFEGPADGSPYQETIRNFIEGELQFDHRPKFWKRVKCSAHLFRQAEELGLFGGEVFSLCRDHAPREDDAKRHFSKKEGRWKRPLGPTHDRKNTFPKEVRSAAASLRRSAERLRATLSATGPSRESNLRSRHLPLLEPYIERPIRSIDDPIAKKVAAALGVSEQDFMETRAKERGEIEMLGLLRILAGIEQDPAIAESFPGAPISALAPLLSRADRDLFRADAAHPFIGVMDNLAGELEKAAAKMTKDRMKGYLDSPSEKSFRRGWWKLSSAEHVRARELEWKIIAVDLGRLKQTRRESVGASFFEMTFGRVVDSTSFGRMCRSENPIHKK